MDYPLLAAQRGVTGRLWQGRCYACPMDQAHCYAAVRYVARNPVRAGMVQVAEGYPWRSAAARCGQRTEPFLSDPFGMGEVIEDWAAWLREPEDEATVTALRDHTHTGRLRKKWAKAQKYG